MPPHRTSAPSRPSADDLALFTRRYAHHDAAGRGRTIGLELEFPLVTRSGDAPERAAVDGLYASLVADGFTLTHDPSTGAVEQASRDRAGAGWATGFDRDIVKTDGGYCTLELALAPAAELGALDDALHALLARIRLGLDAADCRVLGYGVQPVTRPHRGLSTRKGRYRFLEDDAANTFIPPERGVDWHVFTVGAASQCHVSVGVDEAITLTNCLNALSGLFVALFANSAVWSGRVDPCSRAIRELFWDLGWPNRRDQIGVPKRFSGFSDYVETLLALRPLMVARDGEYLAIEGRETFGEFFAGAPPTRARTVDGRPRMITARGEDLLMQAGFAWFGARPSPSHGTVESRVACEQPPGELLCVAALVLGLAEALAPLERFVARRPWHDWQRLRAEAIALGFDATIGERPVAHALAELLELADDGLRRRGRGEQRYLAVLRDRVRARRAPADVMRLDFERVGVRGLVERYAL